MIVMDLDGTLLRGDKTISEYTQRTLNICRERGVKLVLATARAERSANHFCRGFGIDYIIANNGATVAAEGKRIYNKVISEGTVSGLVSQCLSDPRVLSITVELGDLMYTNDAGHHVWSNAGHWNTEFCDFSQPIVGEVSKVSINCETNGIVQGMINSFPELRLFPNTGESWYTITHCASSKFNGVLFLCGRLGIEPENVLAFGDDYNDIEMLKGCGVGVAVGNANEHAKAAADRVCDTNDKDGVAVWLANHFSL